MQWMAHLVTAILKKQLVQVVRPRHVSSGLSEIDLGGRRHLPSAAFLRRFSTRLGLVCDRASLGFLAALGGTSTRQFG